MKRHRKKQRRGESRLDFDSIAHIITSSDSSGKSFSEMGQTRQYAIKNEIKNEVDKLFLKYKVNSDSACLQCLKFIERNHHTQAVGEPKVQNDAVIARLLSKMKLSDRNQLIRLLTHDDEELNEEILEIFPSLRARSETLLETGQRKERRDKIDLQFISDFMHAQCRYVQC